MSPDSVECIMRYLAGVECHVSPDRCRVCHVLPGRYAVMTDCWQQTGKRRPSLEMLAEQVTAMLDDEDVNVDISQLAESMTDYDSFLQPPSSELF